MKHKWADIENAFDFVSYGRQYENEAYLNLTTGEIHIRSEASDVDELPEDFEEKYDNYLSIPHKNELDSGRRLVSDFVEEFMPRQEDTVRRLFKKRGAYAKYKALLEEHGLLQKWYDYETEKAAAALKEWCRKNNLECE